MQIENSNPKKFELKRNRLFSKMESIHKIQIVIKAQILKSRIDFERRQHKSPMGSCLNINKKMLDIICFRFNKLTD